MRHALGVILLFVLGSAQAATVVYSSPGVVTGIGGLEISGMLYNVDFEALGGFNTFGGEVDFWSSANEAITASSAINEIFNFEPEPLPGVNNFEFSVYQVFWGEGCCTEENVVVGGVWQGTGGIPAFPNINVATSWSVVPIPAAVWLFGSGLGLLGWVRRRQTA